MYVHCIEMYVFSINSRYIYSTGPLVVYSYTISDEVVNPLTPGNTLFFKWEFCFQFVQF